MWGKKYILNDGEYLHIDHGMDAFWSPAAGRIISYRDGGNDRVRERGNQEIGC